MMSSSAETTWSFSSTALPPERRTAALQGLRERFPVAQPPLPELFAALAELTAAVTSHGVFNFLMSNGQAQFAHCSTHLQYIVRRWPLRLIIGKPA